MTNTTPLNESALEEILIHFAENFAQQSSDDGSWWGHDINLGMQEDAFNIANQELKALFTEHTKEVDRLARLDEQIRSNSRLISIKKGYLTLEEALTESDEHHAQLSKQENKL